MRGASRPGSVLAVVVFLTLLPASASLAPAHAQPGAASPLSAGPGHDLDPADPLRKSAPPPAPPRNVVNLRAGAAGTTANGRTEICGEVAPVAAVAIEGCGNGSEIVHNDPGLQMSHYLVKVRLLSRPLGPVWIEPRVAVGFAELQVADDGVGFDFTGAGDHGESTSGPEAGLTVRALWPLTRHVEFIAEARATAAWLQHAGDLLEPRARLQPSVALTAGVGF